VRHGLGTVVGEEVEVEFGVGVLDLVDELEAEELVKGNRSLGVLDPDPGLSAGAY
jgi:hypothetical protein